MLGYSFMPSAEAFPTICFGLGVEKDEDIGVYTFESDSKERRFCSIGYSIAFIWKGFEVRWDAIF